MLGLNLAELKTLLPEPKYLHKQVYKHIYARGTTDYLNMTDLALPMRHKLAEEHPIVSPLVQSSLVSRDGTRKWLLGYNNSSIETVFIPDKRLEETSNLERSKGTLCVSSQVGCSLNCTFCFTGTQKFSRNLSEAEIVSQLLFAMSELGDFPLTPTKQRAIDNIVFMVITLYLIANSYFKGPRRAAL
jgi:23S rRNA (adenine2503-C2)-methyltransferase